MLTERTLNNFTAARKRPVVILHTAKHLHFGHAYHLKELLFGWNVNDLDVVIDSEGGNIDAACLIVKILRSHSKRIHACVPRCAKSAATLLCLSADTIWMDESGELGPLDPQIYAKGIDADEMTRTSALGQFRALDELRDFSLSVVDRMAKKLATQHRLGTDQCVKHAINFTVGAMAPLFAQLNPEKIGQRSRDLDVAHAYGRRLIRFTKAQNNPESVLNQLIYRYSSHSFVIDIEELESMRFDVSRFSEDESRAAHNLVKELLDGERDLVLPYSPVPEKSSSPEKEPIQKVENPES